MLTGVRVRGALYAERDQTLTRMADALRGEPPQALVCPITLHLMRDPVMDASGHTFERSAIELLLSNSA
jgi:hypothetical protein